MCVSARKKTKAKEKERPRRDFNKSFENRRDDKNKNLAAEQTNKFGFFFAAPTHFAIFLTCQRALWAQLMSVTSPKKLKSQEKCIVKVCQNRS